MINNVNEKEFNQLDNIDDEVDASILDDEDNEFGGVVNTTSAPVSKNIPTISADFNELGNLKINKSNFNNIDMTQDDYSQYNQLEDDEIDPALLDDDEISIKPTKSFITKDNEVENDIQTGPRFYGFKADFSDDEPTEVVKPGTLGQVEMEIEPEIDPELISEDVIEEKAKKKKVTQGEVEKNILAKLQKKHAKTNVKGSYNSFFHFAGNPPEEMDAFNHMMGSDNITGTGEGVSVGGGEGCGESLNKNEHTKLFEDLLVITGFKLVPTDNEYTIKDKCGMVDDIKCKDVNDVVTNLKPYIDDTITYPLQIETGEKFTNPEEWCKWYTPEMEQKYPKCKSDIKYCDLLANHLKDIKL